jgi:RimJ/RimL family protein N-acetyltransferase
MNLRCFPRTFRSKNGLAVELHHLPAGGGAQLIDRYLAFQPRNSFQGLPPLKDEACVRWVQDMLRTGIHVTASSAASPIIGHAAIFPINQQKCEMLVVVWPGFQDLGIGTALVQSCIDLADELGFGRIWLPVDATNVRGRHVYRKCGFEYASNGQGRELDMACEVRRHRSPSACDAGRPVTYVPAPYFYFPEISHPMARDVY